MKNIYLTLALCITFASCTKKTSELETFLKGKTGDILLPNKAFYVERPVELTSNMSIKGNDSTIIVCKGNAAFYIKDKANNISLENLRIENRTILK